MNQLASMTGFARSAEQQPWGHWVWEIRTLNQKYFDGQFQLPEGCQSLLPSLRKVLQSHVTRGRCDTRLWYSKSETQLAELDMQRVQALCKTIQQVLPWLPATAHINIMDVLKNSEASLQIPCLEEAQASVLISSFESCVLSLVHARQEEGLVLHQFMLERQTTLSSYLQQIEQCLPAAIQARSQIWQAWLVSLSTDIEQTTMDKVMTNFIQRHDVTEEVSRLSCHLASLKKLLAQSGAIGRDLGFLLQEILREINTLGAKAVGVAVVQLTLNMKAVVEQMREQAQNIE